VFDSAPSLDRAGYRRRRLEEFGRVLKTLRRILLKKYLNKNGRWLWNTFELFNG
jgi:hypothetical protein